MEPFDYTRDSSFLLKIFTWLNIGIQIAFPIVSTFTVPVVEARHQDMPLLVESAKKTMLSVQKYTLAAGETAASVAGQFNITVEELRELNKLQFPHNLSHLGKGDILYVPQQTSLAKDDKMPSIFPEILFWKKPTAKSLLSAQKYTLTAGETAVSVAQKFNITVEELRELNQLQFSDNFSRLEEGTILYIPKQAWLAKNNKTSGTTIANVQQNDMQAQKLAGLARQVGSSLANHGGKEAVTDLVLGSATHTINNNTQQWFSRYGTARVQLDINKSFSLQHSQFDFLIAVYEQKNSLIFAQKNLHHTDDRIQSNLGVGLRWFHDNGYMLGGNMFVDYDWSYHHARAGTGIEYWRDFLKLSANSYIPLTNWQDAKNKNMADYQARPANGLDIRGEIWLPILPQLGGKLMYEHYYGNEVALLKREQRQRNPHALIAGINFTPIPLLRFSAEHQFDYSGKSDTRFGLQLNYQLGVPWRQQINPNAISAMRSLAGTRYDLVERNNNIVLEYRKKQVVRLQAPGQAIGGSGEAIQLNVSANSPNGINRIEFSSPELVKAGGQITPKNSDHNSYYVTLPNYLNNDINIYNITWTAVDKKGNRSNPSKTLITVIPNKIDVSQSEVTPTTITLSAGDETPTVLTLKLHNHRGEPVDIEEQDIIARMTSSKGSDLAKPATGEAVISGFTRQAPGQYVATLTAGSRRASFDITVLAETVSIASVKVTVNAETTSANMTWQPINPDVEVAANGKDQHQLRLVVEDRWGNRVTQQSISLTPDAHTAVADNVVTTDDNGEARVNITSQRAGTHTVTPTLHGKPQPPIRVRFIADKPTARIAKGDIVLSESHYQPKTRQYDKTVTVTVTDAHNNPVPDVAVTLTSSNPSTLFSQNTMPTDPQGKVSTRFSLSFAENITLTAHANGGSQSLTVNFIDEHPDDEALQLHAPKQINGAAGDTIVAELTTQDAHKLDHIEWVAPTFIAAGGQIRCEHLRCDVTLPTYQAPNTQKNRYALLWAAVDNQGVPSPPVETQVTVSAETATAKMTWQRISSKDMVANEQDGHQIRMVVKDRLGNRVANQSISLIPDQYTTVAENTVQTNKNGKAMVTITSQKAGIRTVRAMMNGKEQPQIQVNFIADNNTAQIAKNHLKILPEISKEDLTKVPNEFKLVTKSIEKTVIAIVTDAYGNRVPGIIVTFNTDNDRIHVKETSIVTDTDGQAVTTIIAQHSGQATITAQVNKNRQEKKTHFITSDGVEHIKIEKLTGNKRSLAADDETGINFTVSVIDGDKNKVPYFPIYWKLIAGQAEPFKCVTVTNSDGKAVVNVKSHKVGELIMGAYLLNPEPAFSKKVKVKAGNIDTEKSTFRIDKSQIMDSHIDRINMTVTLKDRYDNPVTNKDVEIKVSRGAEEKNIDLEEDNQTGIYHKTVFESPNQEWVLTAMVGEEIIGESIKISGISEPKLHFKTLNQSVAYTKNFTDSQLVEGASEEDLLSWSSSNPDIATVDERGKVTLKKAGSVIISVENSNRSSPASASYTLMVEKADPKIAIAGGDSITTTWADGKNASVIATFNNPDVNVPPLITYNSNDINVVTVDDHGKLTAVKPGRTTITMRTESTDQFVATSATVVYHLEKAKLAVNFKEGKVYAAQKTFKLQQPETPLYEDAVIEWASSQPSVINLSTSGDLVDEIKGGGG